MLSNGNAWTLWKNWLQKHLPFSLQSPKRTSMACCHLMCWILVCPYTLDMYVFSATSSEGTLPHIQVALASIMIAPMSRVFGCSTNVQGIWLFFCADQDRHIWFIFGKLSKKSIQVFITITCWRFKERTEKQFTESSSELNWCQVVTISSLLMNYTKEIFYGIRVHG